MQAFKDYVSVMADKVAKMKEMLLEQSKKATATKDETVRSLSLPVKNMMIFERFKVSTGKEITST